MTAFEVIIIGQIAINSLVIVAISLLSKRLDLLTKILKRDK